MGLSKGIGSKTYVSSIAFLDQREIMKDVIDLYEESTFLDILELTGRQKAVSQPQYHWFENDWLYSTATAAASASGASGDTEVTVNLGTSGASAILPNEIALLGDGTRVYVTEIASASTIKIKALDTTDAISVASGETLVFPSNTQTEANDTVGTKKPTLTKKDNYIHYYRNGWKVTDIQKASTIEVNFKGKPYFTYKLGMDTLLKHKLDVAYGLLLSKKSVRDETDSDGETIKRYTTDGLDIYADSGIQASGDFSASSALDSLFFTVNRTMDKERCPDDYWMWNGGTINGVIEQMFRSNTTSLQQGAIRWDSFGKGNPKQRAIDLGVDSFRIYGRTFHMKKLAALDHKHVTASNGYNFEKIGYGIPTKKIKADGSGNMLDRVCVRYLSGDGTNLKYKVIQSGALAPFKNTDTGMYFKEEYISNQSLQCVGVSQFVKFTDTSS